MLPLAPSFATSLPSRAASFSTIYTYVMSEKTLQRNPLNGCIGSALSAQKESDCAALAALLFDGVVEALEAVQAGAEAGHAQVGAVSAQ